MSMGTMARRMWRAGNAAATWIYRRTGGRIGGRARGGSPVLLLTAPGRSSGQPHTVPVAYIERGGAYYLAATAGGQPKEPQWIRNLRATATASIQVGRRQMPVSVEVLRGAAREAAWHDFITTYPASAPNAQKAGRRIAIARVTPTR
jgi:deazaflavin-dependent oxidoreductase (nitroreductase family)